RASNRRRHRRISLPGGRASCFNWPAPTGCFATPVPFRHTDGVGLDRVAVSIRQSIRRDMALNSPADGRPEAETGLGARPVWRPVVCVLGATVCHFASLYYLLPTLPLWVQRLGGSTYEVGFIVGIFALASLLTRPFVGIWMDRRGRRVFLVAG